MLTPVGEEDHKCDGQENAVKICTFATDSELAGELGRALEQLGVAHLRVDPDTELDAAVLQNDAICLHCGDCREGVKSVFFTTRALAAERFSGRVVLLDVGLDSVTSGALSTLSAAMVRSFPGLALATVTDRIDEEQRPVGAPVRRSWKIGDVAATIAQCGDPKRRLTPGQRLRVGSQLDIARDRK